MNLQTWIDGIFAGSVFAIIALCLTIVYQPTRIMNFAQGEGLVAGAATGYLTLGVWHWPLWRALLAVIVIGAVMGILMERMIMLPVQLSGSKFAWIIATLAAAIIFQSLFNLRFLDAPLRYQPLFGSINSNNEFEEKTFAIGEARIAMTQVIVILLMVILIIFYDQFLRRTLWGRSIRAIAHNPDTSTILGIPTGFVIKLAFVLGTITIVGVGFLSAPMLVIGAAAGLHFTIQGFIAAIIGGVGSPRGAVVGGLTIGILDSVVRSTLGGTLGLFSTFIALAIILIIKPNGLFGKKVEGR